MGGQAQGPEPKKKTRRREKHFQPPVCNCCAGCTFCMLMTRIVKHEHCAFFPHHCSPSVSMLVALPMVSRLLLFFSPSPTHTGGGAFFWRGSNYAPTPPGARQVFPTLFVHDDVHLHLLRASPLWAGSLGKSLPPSKNFLSTYMQTGGGGLPSPFPFC